MEPPHNAERSGSSENCVHGPEDLATVLPEVMLGSEHCFYRKRKKTIPRQGNYKVCVSSLRSWGSWDDFQTKTKESLYATPGEVLVPGSSVVQAEET